MTDWVRWAESHVFTISGLESYRRCPFGFYLKFVKKIPIPPPEGPELTAAEQGAILHRTLEKVWRLRRFEPADVTCLLEDEVARIRTNRPQLLDPLIEIQQGKMKARILAHLQDKWARPAGLRPTYFEWSFTLSLEAPWPVRVGGRIDRIDLDLENRQFLVIDYKTGHRKPPSRTVQDSLQLPLYLLAVGTLLLKDYRPIGGLFSYLAHPVPIGILHADRIPPGLKPRRSSVFTSSEWDACLDKAQREVISIVQRVREGLFPPEPEDCDPWCPFESLCNLRRSYFKDSKRWKTSEEGI